MARGFIQDAKTAPIAPQSCSLRILREGDAALARDDDLVVAGELGPVVGGEVGIGAEAALVLEIVEPLLEDALVDAEHDVGIHLDEAPVGIVGEAPVGALRQRLDRLVVEAEIEDGIHHAGHGSAGAGANRDEERRLFVAEETSRCAR